MRSISMPKRSHDKASRGAAATRAHLRATDVVTERGDEGIARTKELTRDIGADSVLECVGTQQSMLQAIAPAREGG
jgi:threonine dehydrogenase-like Zn-dependent dehydrogenase